MCFEFFRSYFSLDLLLPKIRAVARLLLLSAMRKQEQKDQQKTQRAFS